MKKSFVGIVGLLMLALSACGNQASGLTGTWDGSLTGNSTVFIRFVFTDTNGALTGTGSVCTALSTNCQQTGTIAGARNGTSAQFTLTEQGGTTTWNGTQNGTTLSGSVSNGQGGTATFSVTKK